MVRHGTRTVRGAHRGRDPGRAHRELPSSPTSGRPAWWRSGRATPTRSRPVLPPPLKPAERPLVRANISKVDLPGYPLGAGSVAVAAVHDGQEGWYPLVMPMTHERALIGGREVFGEPKKLGEVTVERDGLVVRASLPGTASRSWRCAGAVDGRAAAARADAGRPTSTSSSCRPSTARASTPTRSSSTAYARRRCASWSGSPARWCCASRCTTRSPTCRCAASSRSPSARRPPTRGAGWSDGSSARGPVALHPPALRRPPADPRRAARGERLSMELQRRDRSPSSPGAASGIGLAMARRFAAEGLKVVLADVEEAALEKAAGQLREEGARVLARARRRQRAGRRASRSPTPPTRPSAPCTCCATTPGSAPAPRAACGSTRSTTGSGPSRSTCGASSTASRPSCRA